MIWIILAWAIIIIIPLSVVFDFNSINFNFGYSNFIESTNNRFLVDDTYERYNIVDDTYGRYNINKYLVVEKSVVTMDAKQFISIYPVAKDHISISWDNEKQNVKTIIITKRKEKEEKVAKFYIKFNYIDYGKINKYLRELKNDATKAESDANVIELYSFLQELCQDKMKQAQKEINIACDEIKEITLRVNEVDK